ncbi:MAG: glycosyltransferase family 4 protein [Caulobacteraceae bacterium]
MPSPDVPAVAPPREEGAGAARVLAGRGILIVVENLPAPFDRRVWQEARALTEAGAVVSIICPTGKGCEARFERLEGIDIHRHPLPAEGHGPLGYLREYGAALFWEIVLAWKVFLTRGFDAIHACNPPDLIFLVAVPFKVLGKKFVFDHHDINPELYEAKFGRRGAFWRLLLFVERLTFALADMSIATNQSYRTIAIERGKMTPERVFVVRSAPDLRRIGTDRPPTERWRNGRTFMVGYVGVMGEQEGIDLLLETVRLLLDRGRSDIQFCLVGGGPSLAGLQRLSAAMGVEPCVTFLGRAPDGDLFDVLASADVCVNPDRVNPMNDKSTMNKIVEYMAFGKPIVQFDVTEGRYSAGEASLYAKANDPRDMADKIEALLGDPAMRARMGALGRARVENALSWDHQAATLIGAYRWLFRRR